MNRRRLSAALVGSALLIGAVIPAPVGAANPPQRELPQALKDLRVDGKITANDGVRPVALAAELHGAQGPQQVIIRLKQSPTAAIKGAAKQKAQLTRVNRQQRAFVDRARAIDRSFKVLGRTQTALNAVLATVSGRALARLSRDRAVESIRPVRDYQVSLDETVPYIGATAVQALGATGKGVTVAVLDSGVDYTHAALGGPGTVQAYQAAYGTKLQHAKNRKVNDVYEGELLYPTDKVIGGFDFVGELWTGGAGSPPLAPDPDPIPCGPSAVKDVCDGTHGTHVTDIIAGEMGVAPDATVLALKVCSSLTTACSGVALIQAMDFALDPNGDGSTADAADIINMSLGSLYGPSVDDDLSFASRMATNVGTVVVAAAGNGGDKPYVLDTPSAEASVISVAQTAVPSSTGFAMLLSTGGGAFLPREAVFQSWSKPLTAADAVTAAPVQFGDGAGGNLLGCDPFPAGSLTGKVVLVDRGVCNFSLKIANIAGGGGKIGVIGLVTPGDPFDGSLGLCPDNLCAAIPGYMVSQATAGLMKDPTALVTFDPANGIALVGHVVGSSARGPSNIVNMLKPEIGAPGASVSAVAGSATGTAPFGGTSGATPMVAGSAALLLDAFPGRSPIEVKAALMNTAETDIMNRPAVFGGDVAPITRIGGGEVRVDRAFATTAVAWVPADQSAGVGFGFVDVAAPITLEKTVRVRNYAGTARTFAISSDFRFANDATNGAVTVSAPASVNVGAHGDAEFTVSISIDPTKLRSWSFNSGSNGASSAVLTTLEYDGYLWLDDTGTTADDDEPLHLPWTVLPRKAAAVEASSSTLPVSGSFDLHNAGQAGTIEAYSLVATSINDPETTSPGDLISDADFKGVGVATFGVPAEFCSEGAPAQFVYAIDTSTWERQSHSVAPVLFEFDIDVDRDGTPDFAVYNRDLGGLSALSDGRNATFVLDLATGDESTVFLTDHGTNSGNTVLYFCAEQLGLGLDDVGSTVDVEAFAVDFYTSGTVRDHLEFPLVWGGERYVGVVDGTPYGDAIAAGATVPLEVVDLGATGTNPTESGLLLRVLHGTSATENLLVEVVP